MVVALLTGEAVENWGPQMEQSAQPGWPHSMHEGSQAEQGVDVRSTRNAAPRTRQNGSSCMPLLAPLLALCAAG